MCRGPSSAASRPRSRAGFRRSPSRAAARRPGNPRWPGPARVCRPGCLRPEEIVDQRLFQKLSFLVRRREPWTARASRGRARAPTRSCAWSPTRRSRPPRPWRRPRPGARRVRPSPRRALKPSRSMPRGNSGPRQGVPGTSGSPSRIRRSSSSGAARGPHRRARAASRPPASKGVVVPAIRSSESGRPSFGVPAPARRGLAGGLEEVDRLDLSGDPHLEVGRDEPEDGPALLVEGEDVQRQDLDLFRRDDAALPPRSFRRLVLRGGRRSREQQAEGCRERATHPRGDGSEHRGRLQQGTCRS